MHKSLVVMLLLVTALGCGSKSEVKGRLKTFKVTGTVKYNGSPVAGADVIFQAENVNKSSFGRTNDQGVYHLSTYSTNDGAPEGRHKVMVIKLSAIAAKKEAPVESKDYVPPSADDPPPEAPKDLVPSKYSKIETTDLVETVDAKDGNVINLELKD